MTTPLDNFVLSYVLAPLAEGFQFARSIAPTIPSSHEIPLPVGVNTVQVVYSGASSVVVNVRHPGKDSVRPSRLQFEAGEGTRMAVSEVPVSESGAVMTFTMMNARADEVRVPVLGVKIFPAPPAS